MYILYYSIQMMMKTPSQVPVEQVGAGVDKDWERELGGDTRVEGSHLGVEEEPRRNKLNCFS